MRGLAEDSISSWATSIIRIWQHRQPTAQLSWRLGDCLVKGGCSAENKTRHRGQTVNLPYASHLALLLFVRRKETVWCMLKADWQQDLGRKLSRKPDRREASTDNLLNTGCSRILRQVGNCLYCERLGGRRRIQWGGKHHRQCSNIASRQPNSRGGWETVW